MPDFTAFLATSSEDRRGAFLTTANRLNTGQVNIEKDFWVCWTLDALFHRLPDGGPRLLFKGGTSLSKGVLARAGRPPACRGSHTGYVHE